ncbi:hypothetical protein BHM03_00028638 [Ensete ventricosum]|nr:hypothetical protein BHM03_00028638 [Ensete ventricosum]
MASHMLNGAELLPFSKVRNPTGLGFHGVFSQWDMPPSFPLPGLLLSPGLSSTKKEAFWFYRFLSIVYDHVINPGHWTEDMRDEALEPADLHDPGLKVVAVGGGTDFTTLGALSNTYPKNVTILDQSPHQLAKAKQKEELKECTIIEGDAEELPFPTDSVDRYISAGR